MTTGTVIKALAIWAGILVLAVLNGMLREAILIPKLGTSVGLVLSGLLLSTLIFIMAYLALPWFGSRRPADLVGIGIGWQEALAKAYGKEEKEKTNGSREKGKEAASRGIRDHLHQRQTETGEASAED